jgi:tRNA-binding EMAP/Myf-like protein
MSSIPSRFVVVLAFVAATLAVAANKPQTFTGRVSDAMCGANHMMGGEASECTRVCIRKGSKYALVVGDKVYTLDTSDKALLDQFDKLADQQAKVTGEPNGDSIAVLSVAAAK